MSTRYLLNFILFRVLFFFHRQGGVTQTFLEIKNVKTLCAFFYRYAPSGSLSVKLLSPLYPQLK